MPISTRHLFTLILFTALFVLAVREISDPDFWWHLRTGQYIVETRTIPHTDIYSFTHSTNEWVTHEWLSEIILYTLYRLGGFGLLIISFATIITSTFALTYWRSEGRPYLAGFVVLLGALATAPTWGVRPQMLSLLLTSIFLLLLDRYTSTANIKFIIPLPPLMALWVNLHSGFALGIALVALYLCSAFVEQLPLQVKTITHYASRFAFHASRFTFHASRSTFHASRSTFHALRALTLVFILCLLAILFNPNGARMYSYPFETLTSRAMQAYIQEWFSPDFHLTEWQPFALLLLALLASALWARTRVSLTHLLLTLFFGYAALHSARHVPLFVLIAIPVLVQQLNALLQPPTETRANTKPTPTPRVVGIANASLCVVMLLAASLRVGQVIENQTKVERAKFPAAAVDYIAAQKLPPPLYDSYGWGGYLIWRLYPEYRVFIDGRADVYGDRFIEEFLRIYRAEPGWAERLAEKEVRLVLVEPDAPLAYALARDANWRAVFADQQSVVFQKR